MVLVQEPVRSKRSSLARSLRKGWRQLKKQKLQTLVLRLFYGCSLCFTCPAIVAYSGPNEGWQYFSHVLFLSTVLFMGQVGRELR